MSRNVAVGLGIAAIAAVAAVRGPLDEVHHRGKETSDIYVLPPPSQVVTLSLGYHAALVDLLWAHVLVSQGLHTTEKRRFENLSLFLDSINELEPTFREPYLMADALFTFQSGTTPREEVLKARAVMERGARALPLDGEIWLVLGQFVAFIAPSYLTDPEEQAAWRLDGAQMMAHAAELGGNDASIGWQALAGVGILGRAGKRDAQILFLHRALAANHDDPELQERLQRELDKLTGEQQIDVEKQRQARLAEIRRRDLPFIKPTLFLVLGPPTSPWVCAGPDRSAAAACAPTWREWAERTDAAALPDGPR